MEFLQLCSVLYVPQVQVMHVHQHQIFVVASISEQSSVTEYVALLLPPIQPPTVIAVTLHQIIVMIQLRAIFSVMEHVMHLSLATVTHVLVRPMFDLPVTPQQIPVVSLTKVRNSVMIVVMQVLQSILLMWVMPVTQLQTLVVRPIREQSSVTDIVVLLLPPIQPPTVIAVTLILIIVEIRMRVTFSAMEHVAHDLNLLIVTHVIV
jgi:hypothetical protein